LADGEYQDAHARAHAEDIARRFTNRTVGTGQIVLFGLTGGLMPCPAALTVLLVCLQLKKFALGFTLVLSFSFGLAITMVAAGAVAAWSVQHASVNSRGRRRISPARCWSRWGSSLRFRVGGICHEARGRMRV
jgi:ABC-type nickel/cobalt efflux system permease component RcnA